MKEFKGTKEEWYIVSSEPVEIATDKKTICFVSIQDYFNKDIEGRSNAKLIVAAPDLLKALQLMVNNFEEYLEVPSLIGSRGSKNQALLKAKKALEKAL